MRHRLGFTPLGTLVLIAALTALRPEAGGRTGAAEPVRLELVRTIPLEGPAGRFDHLALDGKHGRLFVANLSNNSLDVVDLTAGKLVKQVPGQRKIQGVAYAPDLDRIFVGNGADGVCNAFDGRSYALLHSIKLPDADNVRYNGRTGLVYVTHADAAVSAIDARTFAVRATVRLPGSPEALQLDPTRARLYVNTLKPARVAVIDTEKHAVVQTIPLTRADANYPLALDPAGGRVFVGCRKPPAVVVVDAKAGREVASFTIPGDTDDLYYDAKRDRLYAICGAGFLAVAERAGGQGQYQVVERIATARLARTGLFDPDSGRLYVILPRQSEQQGPQLRVYEAKP